MVVVVKDEAKPELFVFWLANFGRKLTWCKMKMEIPSNSKVQLCAELPFCYIQFPRLANLEGTAHNLEGIEVIVTSTWKWKA